MNKHQRIFVAGARGLVGSALVRSLCQRGYEHLLTPSRTELDLSDPTAVSRYFADKRPEFVFLAAAKVGGVHANNTYPVDFLLENLKIQNNIVSQCHAHGIERLLFLGSSCIYPKFAKQPMKETELLAGPLEPTNKPYAIAKITGITLCDSYNRQYGTNYVSVMPTNLFGLGDNYHPENSHVIPGLLRRFHEAKIQRKPTVTLWGTGTPKREFLYADDLAEACITVMNNTEWRELINIGSGMEVTIQELAELIREVVGFEGELQFDASMPDGTPRKLLDSSKIMGMGWTPKIDLKEGLRLAYGDFVSNYDSKK